MRTPEQQGIDVGGVDWREQTFGEHHHLVTGGLAALDELDEAGTRRAGERDLAAGDHRGVLDGADVGTRRHGADRADDGCPAARGRFDERRRAGRDDVDDRHGELVAQLVETGRGGGVAGDDDRLDVVVVDEARRQLPGEASHLPGGPRSVRIARRVTDVHEVFGREQVDDSAGDGQPSEPGVEHPDRPIHGQQATFTAFPGHAGRWWPLARWRSLARIGATASLHRRDVHRGPTSVEITAPPNRNANT